MEKNMGDNPLYTDTLQNLQPGSNATTGGSAAGAAPQLAKTQVNTQALAERFDAVHTRLQAALLAAGKQAEDVTLVAVSKFHPAAALAAVAGRWAEVLPGSPVSFGESYVQEALPKQDLLRGLSGAGCATAPVRCNWHFIGHLQKNKAKYVAGRFNLIHTLDSLDLARNLQKEAAKVQGTAGEGDSVFVPVQAVLVQVNIGEEAQKSGIDAENIPSFISELQHFKGLHVAGLMCMPPYDDNPELSRPYFARLRQLRDKVETQLGIKLTQLSMGMSHDFEVAIQEGATIVRVGTDIFGPR